jgi:hypothetical protein
MSKPIITSKKIQIKLKCWCQVKVLILKSLFFKILTIKLCWRKKVLKFRLAQKIHRKILQLEIMFNRLRFRCRKCKLCLVCIQLHHKHIWEWWCRNLPCIWCLHQCITNPYLHHTEFILNNPSFHNFLLTKTENCNQFLLNNLSNLKWVSIFKIKKLLSNHLR